MSRPHVLSPAELSSLRDLELIARTTVEGLRQGLHRSPLHGYTAEFSQYRHYRPGDDLKFVDWKLFGRTDRLYSRQFRETTNLGALVVLDVSRSMAFPEDASGLPAPASKFALARTVAAVLVSLVIDQGDAAGWLAVSSSRRDGTHYVPPRSGRHHQRVCLGALARLACDGTAGVTGALTRAAALMRRRGLVVVISDFYEDDAALIEMRRLARMGHDVIAVQVMAGEELRPPQRGAVEFEDLESGARLNVDVAVVRGEYERRVQAFLTGTGRAVQREGLDYLRLVTGEPLEPALRRFLVGRRAAAAR